MKLGSAIALGCFAVESAARALGGSPKDWIKPYKREALQDIVSAGINQRKKTVEANLQKVTWDEDSLFVHGERIFLYSGEVHPYRYVILNSIQ